MKVRPSSSQACGDDPACRVVDDLADKYPITSAELDAVEAFLMPQLNAILGGKLNGVERPFAAPRPDSQAPQYPALEKAGLG